MNIDDFRSVGKTKETIDRLEQGKVDIARIQETHDTNATDMRIGAYAIYSTPAPKTERENEPGNAKGQGGIAIIRTELTANIKEVTKWNDRLMYIRIQTAKNTNNILLMNSNAPHMGYKADIRRKYWTGVKNALQHKKKEMDV